MTGAKALLKQLRKEHEGHYEEITGRITGEFSHPNLVRRKPIGDKAAVIVGAGRGGSGADTSVPRIPSIEVASFRHLDDRCPG
jgi:hypothetical protein